MLAKLFPQSENMLLSFQKNNNDDDHNNDHNNDNDNDDGDNDNDDDDEDDDEDEDDDYIRKERALWRCDHGGATKRLH